MTPDNAKELMESLFRSHFSRKLSQEDVDRIMSQDNVHYFKQVEDGKIVAIVALYIVELLSRKLGVIEEVVTLRDSRNQGFATNLIRDAIGKAKRLGCTCVELTAKEDNEELHLYYEGVFNFKDRNNKSFRKIL